MKQAGATLIVSSATNVDVANRLALKLVVVDRPSLEEFHPGSIFMQHASPSSTLYVAFTSGSTGKPKGAVMTHTNFASAVKHQAAALHINATARVFDFASYSFDVAVNNALMTLSVGGCVCVPSKAERQNDIEGAINRTRANVVELTPSVARLLNPSAVPSVNLLNLAGEQLGSSDIAPWLRYTKVINTYGPAECTITTVANTKISKVLDAESTSIGYGLGAVTWIVDPSDHSCLAPLGAVGELVIEGPLVGRGYLGDPEKTANSFIQDPPWLPSERCGRPLYKTGDLVRYRSNGSIDYVGRKDMQVKLRGQRIELNEVEHCVRQCLPKGVDIVAEVVQPNGRTAMLAAFICLPADEVKKHQWGIATQLAELLPTYMIPSAYVGLEKMSLTLSGKIDRKWLKRMGASLSPEQLVVDSSGLSSMKRDDQPKTKVQLALRDLWAQVLNIEIAAINLNSNFFMLGGDSILAMKLVVVAREERLLLTVAMIFQNPRLCHMAQAGRVANGAVEFEVIQHFSLLSPHTKDAVRQVAAACCNVEEESIEDIYPCTSLQEGLKP